MRRRGRTVTTTPLPAARPSSFTTYGAPNSSSAAAASSAVTHSRAAAVGTPAAAITSLANALEPSSWAAAPDGPKQAIPRSVTASATPATSGASGPTTTRSTPSDSARSATPGTRHRVDVVQRGDGRHAGVAGGGMHLGDTRIERESAGQGVLTAARADDECLQGCLWGGPHGPTCYERREMDTEYARSR